MQSELVKYKVMTGESTSAYPFETYVAFMIIKVQACRPYSSGRYELHDARMISFIESTFA